MDNETAVKWLKEIERKYIHGGDDSFDYLRKEAINLATDKLSAQITRGDDMKSNLIVFFRALYINAKNSTNDSVVLDSDTLKFILEELKQLNCA